MENILYSIPNNAIYFSSVRLVVGGILNTLKRDIEEIEDMKISVTAVSYTHLTLPTICSV